jgi:Zn-dependent alcohol dehydrogenase
MIGAGPIGTRFTIDSNHFLFNRHLHGVVSGNSRPSIDIPKYVDFFMAGKLPLDRLVTREYSLAQINEAMQALEGSDPGRGVVRFQ